MPAPAPCRLCGDMGPLLLLNVCCCVGPVHFECLERDRTKEGGVRAECPECKQPYKSKRPREALLEVVPQLSGAEPLPLLKELCEDVKTHADLMLVIPDLMAECVKCASESEDPVIVEKALAVLAGVQYYCSESRRRVLLDLPGVYEVAVAKTGELSPAKVRSTAMNLLSLLSVDPHNLDRMAAREELVRLSAWMCKHAPDTEIHNNDLVLLRNLCFVPRVADALSSDKALMQAIMSRTGDKAAEWTLDVFLAMIRASARARRNLRTPEVRAFATKHLKTTRGLIDTRASYVLQDLDAPGVRLGDAVMAWF